MNFASTVEVVADAKSDVFNAISLYVPSSLAQGNIVNWQQYASELTADRPIVLVADVSNYNTIMDGELLRQWIPAFNQDTNIAMVVYLIVFDDTQSGGWSIQERSISYAPLSKAFEKLWFVSYIKMLFDPNMKGIPATVVVPGTNTTMDLVVENTTGALVTMPAGSYIYDSGDKQYLFVLGAPVDIADQSATSAIQMESTTVGPDAVIAEGAILPADFVPALEAPLSTLTFTVSNITQGVDESTAEVPSQFFDLSLALSELCRNYRSLSYFYCQVNIDMSNLGYPVVTSVDPNVCKVSSAELEDEIAFLTALNVAPTAEVPLPRSNYFYAALVLIGASNTFFIAHSEDENILTQMLGAWFMQPNSSGTYIGNKMSLLRLSGVGIKPFGYPSWLNGAVNENYEDGQKLLDAKQVAYLVTISDSSVQDCVVSRAVGVATSPAMPVTADMISAYIDYTCRQEAANFITDKGTLVSPVLTDEMAYMTIQQITLNTINLFSGTNGRLYAVQNLFPSFAEAKVSMTALEAASAWKARYKDDLDSISVTGGISAQ